MKSRGSLGLHCMSPEVVNEDATQAASRATRISPVVAVLPCEGRLSSFAGLSYHAIDCGISFGPRDEVCVIACLTKYKFNSDEETYPSHVRSSSRWSDGTVLF